MDVHTATMNEKYIDRERTPCRACLSVNRDIYLLSKSFREMYFKICECQNEKSSDVYVCWECLALLNKIKLFKERAQTSEKILQLGLYKANSQASLSSLSFSYTFVSDSFKVIKDESREEAKKSTPVFDSFEAIKEEDEKESIPTQGFPIKVEPDGNDSDNFNDFIDYGQIEEIKEEAVTKRLLKHIKKEKKKVKKKGRYYKITYLSCKGKIVNKIAIDLKDVAGWVERERNSDYFKNLKKKCELCLCKITKNVTPDEHDRTFHVHKSRKLVHQCDICKTYYSSSHALSVHAKQHLFYRKCGVCGYECYTQGNMLDHIEVHKRIVQCIKCKASFNTLQEMRRHSRALHKWFICDYCNKHCKIKHSLERHIIRTHLNPGLRCTVCNTEYKHRKGLATHIQLRHTVQRTEQSFCVMCDIQFDNVGLFKRHVKYAVAHKSEWDSKPKKKVIPCLDPDCPNVYRTSYGMRNHYRFYHTDTVKYHCAECNKSFLNRTKLVYHRRSVHEGYVPEKNKLCTICGRGFSNNRILTHHVRTHTGERPHQCALCDSKFAQKTALQTHIKFIHLKAKRKHSNYE